MYLFGSFCDYDLSDRKKVGISAKKPICRVEAGKSFFAGKKKLIMRYVFVFILASWLSNKNITGL
jgi:hypothetical protein